TDRKRAAQLYEDSLNKKISMLPLVMDFSKPTPARGLGQHWSIPASERLACELVLAMGTVEHLVGVRRMNFEQIAAGLALFAKRWVLVEFVSGEEASLPKDWSARFSWYSLDNFM